MGARRGGTLIGRAALAVALWAGFWALGAAVVAALAAVPVTQLRYSNGPDFGGLAAGALACAVVWALRPRGWFARRPKDADHPLEPGAFPALHALAARVASRCGARPPDVLLLMSGAQAFIRVDRRWLGLRRRRTIGIGLPLFAFLSEAELASVVAHELGHQRGGDLALGPWVHRTRRSIAAAVDELDGSAFLLDAPFRAYGALFLRVSAAVSREQELAADASAAAACGAGSTASALRKLEALGPLWEAYLDLDVIRAVNRGARVPIIDGFRAFVAAPCHRPEVTEYVRAARERPPAVGDTHPPTEERIAALEESPPRTPPSALAGEDCLHLLGGVDVAERAFYERFTTGPLPAFRWDDLGRDLLAPAIAKALSGGPLDPHRSPLTDLPRHVADAEGIRDRLGRGGVSFLSPEAKRREGRRIVADWLTAALAARGFTPEVRPGEELVVRRDGAELEPARIVEDLARGALSEAEWRSACGAWEREPSV
jgi:Zn-dependent protease with chaperone function